jgi:hypothetical protein
VFEGKCLKEGLRNGAEASIPFWLAHRLRRAPVCRRGRPWLSAKFGALGGVLPDSALSDSKARGGFSGAGLILATMKICR